MALTLDSQAVFAEKVLNLGFSEAQLEEMKKLGIKTLGDAAFVLQLEAADASDQLEKLAGKVCTSGAPLPGDIARLRRLLTMANTMAAFEFKKVSEEHDGCKMPRAERELRMTALRKKFGAVITSGYNEPSLALISSIFVFKERGALAHLPLAQCTSRRQELAGQKTEDKLKMVDGQLKLVSGPTLECDVNNPLLARQAMRRRSLTFELVGIASYEILETVSEELFSYMQEPPPSSFQAPGIERILRADAELWTLIGEHQAISLEADALGILPIDKAIQEYCSHARVRHHLQPLPLINKRSTDNRDAPEPKRSRPSTSSTSNRPAAKARSKSARTPKAPKELVGLSYTAGCCYSYNLKGCDRSDCPHKHICARCGQKHPLRDCKTSSR